MKKRTYVCVLLACMTMACAAQKKLETQPPFKLGPVTSQNFIGDSETEGTVITLNIPVTSVDLEAVSFLEVFHRGKTSKVSATDIGNGVLLSAELPNGKGMALQAIAFKLKTSEAVLGYRENGTKKYVKITGIKRKGTLIQRTKPKN
ncbi:hypothetical protein [Maribacter sp. 2307ULW6-5]|uniref:hypothetical protein n=1 Tax=Maribacter sp. 2307ULW6-5 TaxID=3386275 RepID=UPI0039BD31A4